MKPSRFLPVILAGLALSWAGSAFAFKPSALRELSERRIDAIFLDINMPGLSGLELAAVLANTPPEGRDPTAPWLLAPIDLQAVKAAGVTFAVSMLTFSSGRTYAMQGLVHLLLFLSYIVLIFSP